MAEGDTSPKRLLLFGTDFPFVAQQFYSAFPVDGEALLASSLESILLLLHPRVYDL